MSGKGDPNISQILPWLFVGNRKAAKDRKLLLSLGISRVLNCTPSKDEDPRNGVPNFYPKSFCYKRIPVYDNTASSLADHFETGVSFMEVAKCYGNVFVHCLQGRCVPCFPPVRRKRNQLKASHIGRVRYLWS